MSAVKLRKNPVSFFCLICMLWVHVRCHAVTSISVMDKFVSSTNRSADEGKNNP